MRDTTRRRDLIGRSLEAHTHGCSEFFRRHFNGLSSLPRYGSRTHYPGTSGGPKVTEVWELLSTRRLSWAVLRPGNASVVAGGNLESQAHSKLNLPRYERRSKAQALAGDDVALATLNKSLPQHQTLTTYLPTN